MGDKKVILAIDDMVTTLTSLQAILEPLYEVRLSNSASTAMKMLEKITIDLILLDIEMPGVSGFEFLHWIRKAPKCMHIPVIIVSGHSASEFFSHALQQGADDCVPKPVEPEELLKKIQVLFDNPPQHKLFDL